MSRRAEACITLIIAGATDRAGPLAVRGLVSFLSIVTPAPARGGARRVRRPTSPPCLHPPRLLGFFLVMERVGRNREMAMRTSNSVSRRVAAPQSCPMELRARRTGRSSFSRRAWDDSTQTERSWMPQVGTQETRVPPRPDAMRCGRRQSLPAVDMTRETRFFGIRNGRRPVRLLVGTPTGSCSRCGDRARRPDGLRGRYCPSQHRLPKYSSTPSIQGRVRKREGPATNSLQGLR
jgi:hypothetical protein